MSSWASTAAVGPRWTGGPTASCPSLRVVGALLDATAVHGGRTAAAHLLGLARSNALPGRRVHEVLDLVGLTAVAGRRIGGFSLGMHQRLGIAAALLGDPAVLLLDEPLNGLDTEGIRWVRTLLRRLAAEGRAVLLSSHLMSEMELVADHVVVIGRGRLIADTTVADLIERHAGRPPPRHWCGRRRRAPRPCADCSRTPGPGSSPSTAASTVVRGRSPDPTRPPSASWPGVTASPSTSSRP